MNYLYHMVPEKMTGKFLMPLNELKIKHPLIYGEEVKKYQGREGVLDRRIPFLNCLWNDVLHLTAVSPSKLNSALTEAGRPLKKINWFKVNPKFLDLSNTIVYLYPDKPRPERHLQKYFVPFNIKDLPKYNSIGKKTKDYFKKEISEGQRPLLFHLVPHILYKGHLNINELDRITV